MSTAHHNAHDDGPRFDAWLAVMSSSVIPVLIAIFLPAAALAPLVAAGVLLFVAGSVMLRLQSARQRREQTVQSSAMPSPTPTRDTTPVTVEGAAS